jgi:hypothetical protein
MSPIAGLVRLRFNQVAKQTLIGSAVAATRRVPWRGALTYDPGRTDPDVDVGSLDPVISPYPTAVDVGWAPTGPITFNDLPIRLAAGLMGGITPTTVVGAARQWAYQVASLTPDAFDYFVDEFGDDTEATDAIIGFGGVADVLEETLPEDGGPWTFSDTWIFAGATLGSNATNSLVVDPAPVFAFGTDTATYMDSVAGSIGITPLVDAIHGMTLRVSNNFDRKRYQNGSNTRFQLSGYGRGARVIELVLTLAKTATTIAEANTLDDSPVPNRFFKIATTSTELAAAATPYVYERQGAFRLFSRAEGEIGGNTTIVLTYRAYYDATLTYAYKARVVNQLTAQP